MICDLKKNIFLMNGVIYAGCSSTTPANGKKSTTVFKMSPPPPSVRKLKGGSVLLLSGDQKQNKEREVKLIMNYSTCISFLKKSLFFNLFSHFNVYFFLLGELFSPLKTFHVILNSYRELTF